VLDPGVADLGELGQAGLQVDTELVTQRVELHADLVAGHAAGAAARGTGGLRGRTEQSGRSDCGGAGGGRTEEIATADG
jgi:hypothetical protein